jgi:hypothetical protein
VRLPFPERVPLVPVCFFATVLCFLQLYQGTAPAFSLCSFLFIIVSALAFNTAGGLTRPSGGYIFFFVVLGVLIGLVWKAVLGEPANSYLVVPPATSEQICRETSGAQPYSVSHLMALANLPAVASRNPAP